MREAVVGDLGACAGDDPAAAVDIQLPDTAAQSGEIARARRTIVWPEASTRAAPPLPRLGGWALGAVQRLSSLPGTSVLVRAAVCEALGIRALARLPDVYRGELPDAMRPLRARHDRRIGDGSLPVVGSPAWPHGIEAYRAAFARGDASPITVAERALAAARSLSRRSPTMNVMAACDAEAVVHAAREASERHARGAARPLEGVPFLVKDQHDVAGLPTRFGARHVPPPALVDATIVARLRAAGAVVLGKSLVTEWGISPLGVNVHVTMPKNAHDPTRAPGGSSTGSAVGVALGLGPFATGADAGGSVRVPAVVNGVLGIKPTFGRISRTGEAFSGSLNHLGLLGVTASDLALLLDIVSSEHDAADPMTTWAPRPPRGGFGAALGDGVRGLRIGIDEAEWRDADPEIVAVCRGALEALQRDGAKLHPVRVPLARHATAIGIATIGCEGVALASTVDRAQFDALAPDLRVAMNVAAGVSAADYLDIQRLRVGMRQQLAAALRQVDVIASPVLPRPTPKLADRDRRKSFSDAALVTDLCRYTLLANLTGVPAASAPVGADHAGLPVGLSITGDAWDEATVLGAVAHLERAGISEIRRPPDAIDLLGIGATR